MTSLERRSQERARKEAIADWKERKIGSGKAAALGRLKEEQKGSEGKHSTLKQGTTEC